jgi:hypothetical protein
MQATKKKKGKQTPCWLLGFLFVPEDERSMLFQNISKRLPDHIPDDSTDSLL